MMMAMMTLLTLKSTKNLYNRQQTRRHMRGRRRCQCRWKPSQASIVHLRCHPPSFWQQDRILRGWEFWWWWWWPWLRQRLAQHSHLKMIKAIPIIQILTMVITMMMIAMISCKRIYHLFAFHLQQSTAGEVVVLVPLVWIVKLVSHKLESLHLSALLTSASTLT